MGELTYSQYVGTIMQLDKARYAEIQSNPELKAQFDSATPEQRLGMFKPEFQDSVAGLFKSFESYQNATQVLAKSIFRVIQVSGSTLDEASALIETALNKTLSRSYMSKLYRIGELLTSKPELSAVKDVEKLAELSRIPASRLDKALESMNVASATRDQVRDLVKQETSGVSGVEGKSPEVVQKLKYAKMLKQLEEILKSTSIDDDFKTEMEFISAIQTAIRVINARVSALNAKKAA